MRYGKKEIAGHELSEANEAPDYRTINRQLQAEINYHVLGRHMQTVRQDHGMTQAAVAEKMKLGTKYYASLEEGSSHISLYRLIQFICIMHSSADYLLAGSHADYPSKYECPQESCEVRRLLNSVLDQLADDQIETLYIVARGFLEQGKKINNRD